MTFDYYILKIYHQKSHPTPFTTRLGYLLRPPTDLTLVNDRQMSGDACVVRTMMLYLTGLVDREILLQAIEVFATRRDVPFKRLK